MLMLVALALMPMPSNAQIPSWAMPDNPLTSDTGLNPGAILRQPDKLFSGILTFWYFHMIFQYHIARITPSAAIYGRALCIPFTTNNTSSMHVQGIFTSTARVYPNYPFYEASSMDMYGVSLSTEVQSVSISTTGRMEVQGVSFSTASSIYMHCVMCIPFTTNKTSSNNVQGVSFSTASSMDVQGVSLSTTSSMDMQGVPLF
jgi:hypothetical protein